jgi:hypothetical protein
MMQVLGKGSRSGRRSRLKGASLCVYASSETAIVVRPVVADGLRGYLDAGDAEDFAFVGFLDKGDDAEVFGVGVGL